MPARVKPIAEPQQSEPRDKEQPRVAVLGVECRFGHLLRSEAGRERIKAPKHSGLRGGFRGPLIGESARDAGQLAADERRSSRARCHYRRLLEESLAVHADH